MHLAVDDGALARGLRLLGTPGAPGARTALAAALNAAYDAMLTKRAYAGGRSRRDQHLLAVLNVSHQFAEAAAALRATGERVPPLVTDTIERLGDAVLHSRGPGSGVLGFGGWRAPSTDHDSAGRDGPVLPLIPPQWSSSPGASSLRASWSSPAPSSTARSLSSVSAAWSPSWWSHRSSWTPWLWARRPPEHRVRAFHCLNRHAGAVRNRHTLSNVDARERMRDAAAVFDIAPLVGIRFALRQNACRRQQRL